MRCFSQRAAAFGFARQVTLLVSQLAAPPIAVLRVGDALAVGKRRQAVNAQVNAHTFPSLDKLVKVLF